MLLRHVMVITPVYLKYRTAEDLGPYFEAQAFFKKECNNFSTVHLQETIQKDALAASPCNQGPVFLSEELPLHVPQTKAPCVYFTIEQEWEMWTLPVQVSSQTLFYTVYLNPLNLHPGPKVIKYLI